MTQGNSRLILISYGVRFHRSGAAFLSAHHVIQIPLHIDNNVLCTLTSSRLKPVWNQSSDSHPAVLTSALTLSSSALNNSRSLFRLSIWRSLPDRTHGHGVLAQTAFHMGSHRLQWKYPYSPVIEASVWRSKRLIKYVQLPRKSKTMKSWFFCWSTSEQHTVCTRASATSEPYLRLCLHAGRRDVADLDERLWVVIIVVLLLWFVLIGDDHHRFHVFGERGCVQEVRWGLTRRQREGSLVKPATEWYHHDHFWSVLPHSPTSADTSRLLVAVTQHWSHPTTSQRSALLHQAVWGSGSVSWSTPYL